MRYPYDKGSVEHWRHIRRSDNLLLTVWKPCPVFDAFSAALADELAEWKRIREAEASRPPDCWFWDDD